MNSQYPQKDHLLFYSKEDSTQSCCNKGFSEQSFSTNNQKESFYEMKYIQPLGLQDMNRPLENKKTSVVSFAYQSTERENNFFEQEQEFANNYLHSLKTNMMPSGSSYQSQITELECLLNDSKKNATDLQQIVGNLMREIDECRKQRDDLQQQLNDKNRQLQLAKDSSSSLLNKSFIKQDDYLENKVLRYQEEIYSLKSEIAKIQKQNDPFEDRNLKELECAYEDRISLVNKQLERKDKEIIAIRQQVYQFEEEINYIKTENENWHRIAEDYQRKFEILKQETITSAQQIQLYQDEQRIQNKRNQEFEYRVNLLLSENEKLNKLLSERLDQVEKMKLLLDSKQEDWKNEKKSLQVKYESIINEKQNLLAKEKQTLEKNHSFVMTNNKSEFQRQIAILSAQNQQLNQLLHDQKGQLEDLSERYNQEVSFLQYQNQEILTTRETLNNKSQELNQLLGEKEQEADKLYSDLDALGSKNFQLEQEIEKLLIELEDVKENMKVELLEKEKQLAEVCQSLQAISKQCECSEKQSTIQRIEQEVQELRRQKQEMEQKLGLQLQEKTELIGELQDHLQEIHLQINGSKQERENFKQQNQILKQELQKTQEKYKDISSKSELKIGELQQKLTRNSRSEEEYFLPSFKMQEKQNLLRYEVMEEEESQEQQNQEEAFQNSTQMDQDQEQSRVQKDYSSKSLPPQRVTIQQLQNLVNHDSISKLRQYTLSTLNHPKSYTQKFHQQLQKKMHEKKTNNSQSSFFGNLDTFGNRERSVSCLEILQDKKVQLKSGGQTEFLFEDEEYESQAEMKYQLWQKHQKEHYLQPAKSTPILRIQKRN